MTVRTNEEWVEALSNPASDDALGDLRSILLKGLSSAFTLGRSLERETIEDITQDALMKVFSKLDTFEGRGRFTTWSMRIAVNLALTELRRRRIRDISLDGLIESKWPGFIPEELSDPLPGPEAHAVGQTLLKALKRTIARELTKTQRVALVAVYINRIPLEEVARKMGKEKNALYKLLHDARLRLKDAVLREGFTAQEAGDAFKRIRELVDIVLTTHPHEIGCDETCEYLDQYTDLVVAGKSTQHTLPQVQLHLAHCPDCREEFEILLEATRAIP